MGPVVIDANVGIARMQAAHRNHHRAGRLLSKIQAPIAIHPITLAECLVLPIKRGFDPEEVELETLAILTARLGTEPELTSDFTWPAKLAETRAKSGLKMPDAIVLATAIILDGQVASFDEGLRSNAAALGRLFQES